MMPSVTVRSSHTSGEAIVSISAITGAISAASGSGAASAIRFGISSPSTSDRKVVITITTPKAIAGTYCSSPGQEPSPIGVRSSDSVVAP